MLSPQLNSKSLRQTFHPQNLDLPFSIKDYGTLAQVGRLYAAGKIGPFLLSGYQALQHGLSLPSSAIVAWWLSGKMETR